MTHVSGIRCDVCGKVHLGETDSTVFLGLTIETTIVRWDRFNDPHSPTEIKSKDLCMQCYKDIEDGDLLRLILERGKS